MVLIELKCPFCNTTDVSSHGSDKNGKKRYKCNNSKCSHYSFAAEYAHKAKDPYIRSRIFWATVNGCGCRAIARTLGIDKDTVTRVLKTVESDIWCVNYDYIAENKNSEIEAEIVQVDEAEMDEMWSFYHDKSNQIWLWWAIDHQTGVPIAFCFGTREDKNLEKLLELLQPFDIKLTYCDGNPAYPKHLGETRVAVGKDKTQKIERKHLSLRTWCSRLVRKGIRFSKNKIMHELVVGIIINYWWFNRIIW